MSTRGLGLFAAWLVGTILAVALASQAVGLVRDQVTDRPSRTVSTILSSVTTSTTSTTISTDLDSTVPIYATTTTPPDTTTTQTGSTASTTTTPPTPDQRYTLTGGWVTVACSGDQILFRSAAPQAGFQVDRTEVADGSVEVKFESPNHVSTFHARCMGGTVSESIDEGGHHSDD
jgi:hypothetical protein